MKIQDLTKEQLIKAIDECSDKTIDPSGIIAELTKTAFKEVKDSAQAAFINISVTMGVHKEAADRWYRENKED